MVQDHHQFRIPTPHPENIPNVHTFVNLLFLSRMQKMNSENLGGRDWGSQMWWLLDSEGRELIRSASGMR